MTETSCITITPLFSATSLASLSVKVVPPLVCNLGVRRQDLAVSAITLSEFERKAINTEIARASPIPIN